HYGLRPRFAGSVSIHEPDPRRGVLAAAHAHGHGDGRVRHVRAALLDDLDLQVQLCTPGGGCGWHLRAAGDEHGHTESARDSPMGAARARAGRRVLLQSDRWECGNRARRLVLSFAARNRWRAWCRPVLVCGPESADALAADSGAGTVVSRHPRVDTPVRPVALRAGATRCLDRLPARGRPLL